MPALLQYYFYSESDIKEPQPSPFFFFSSAPSFGFDITQRKKYSFHCFCIAGASKLLHCYHFLSLNMNYFNPAAINSLLDENKKGWKYNLTFVLLIYLVSSSFTHCCKRLKYLSMCVSYLRCFF